MIQKEIINILEENNYDFFHKKITKSTMYDCQNHLSRYNKNCIYLSDQQTEGRGQRGNNWQSPSGNIYCSISFNNFLDITQHFLFSILISVTIKMSLERFNAKNIFFKWPNDIFYNKKKFAGMISEVINIDQKRSYIVIGLGINFISSPKLSNYKTTFVKSFCQIKTINDFLLVFFEFLFINVKKLQEGKKNQLIKNFTKSLMFIDNKICVLLPNNSQKEGFFRGINNDGSLKLEINGRINDIYSGSIKL